MVLALPFVVLGRGRVGVGSPKKLREIKSRMKRNKRVPHPILNHRASSQPLLGKEGSAICDWFSKLFHEESFAMSGLNILETYTYNK
jgi:hypothetical protein